MINISKISSIYKPVSKYTNIIRHFVKVGDKVNITYIKDAQPIFIKEDKEYPDWVFTLTDKLPSRVELLNKMETEGVGSLSLYENRRLRRLLTIKDIKDFNLSTVADDD